MLIRILPEQVSNSWNVIAPMIVQSLPPTMANSPVMLSNILTSVMLEQADVWVYTEGEGQHKAVVLTSYMFDSVARVKMLVLYAVYGIVPLTDNIWEDGLTTLRRFAKSRGCASVIAYTQFEHIKKMTEKQGADTSYTLITMGVDQ